MTPEESQEMALEAQEAFERKVIELTAQQFAVRDILARLLAHAARRAPEPETFLRAFCDSLTPELGEAGSSPVAKVTAMIRQETERILDSALEIMDADED
ncbi:MAG TPA: hypothetical protein VGS12_03260 [Caulobacteraceae bacterium]|nr:hypothetical protein [Caulobacteraceae bacterium]